MKSHWIGCTRENGLGAIRVVREVHLEVAQTISDAPIYADADGIVDPELGEWRCPNGHDSSIPPKLPELMFKACGHYATEVTWNEFCITCGVRHTALAIYWRADRIAGRVQNPKNYCGYCGAKMVNLRVSR